MASLVQWTRGGTAGRVTTGGERDAQLTVVVTWSRQHSSPSNSSEPSDQQSSSAVASTSQEQAQQLGAPPRVTEQKSPPRGSSSSPLTPGRVGPDSRRRTIARLVEELEAVEFMDANTEVGYMDNEFMPMWWKEASDRDRRAYWVWAVKDSDKVLLYFFNDGMYVINVSELKKGHERAIREQNELQ